MKFKQIVLLPLKSRVFKNNKVNNFFKVQKTNNIRKLQSSPFTNNSESVKSTILTVNNPKNLRRLNLINQVKSEIQEKKKNLVLRPVDRHPNNDKEYKKAHEKNWQLQQDLLKSIDEYCDNLESISSSTYPSKIEASDDLSVRYVEDRKVILEIFHNFRECQEMMFDFFSGSLCPDYLPFSYGVESSDLQELLSSKDEEYSVDEVEWLKLLNVTHQVNWLSLSQEVADEFKDWKEDWLKTYVGCNLNEWSRLFSRFSKVEAGLRKSFEETLSYYNKCEVVTVQDVNFTLKELQSLKNASLLRNAVKKSTNLIRCKRAFQFSRWPNDHNKSNILRIYLYFLQREYDFQGELCPVNDQDKLELSNDFNLSLLPRKDQIEDQVNDKELIDEFESLILSHKKESLHHKVLEFGRKIPISATHRSWDSIDFTSLNSESFFKDLGVCTDEKKVTLDWDKLMQLIQVIVKVSYLFRIVDYSFNVWSDRYPLDEETSEVQLTVLDATSSEEINLSYKNFLVLNHELLSSNVDKLTELLNILEGISVLREEIRGFLSKELDLWKQQKISLLISLESALKKYDEKSYLDHDGPHESLGIQPVTFSNVNKSNGKRLKEELRKYVILSILAALIIFLIMYYLS